MKQVGSGKPGDRRRGRALGAIGIIALLGLTGCGLGGGPKREPPKVAPREESPTPLEAGASATFTFAADGVWYPAPILILRDQRVRVSLSERSSLIPDGIVRYRIGKMEQVLISPAREFIVTQPGAMYFFYDPARGYRYQGEVEVTVTRTR